jgi:cation:H+ antiporter
MLTLLWIVVLLLSVGAIVWGAETFAEHLASAASQLGVSSFALALLLAGAEPEELATAVTASIRKLPAIALGDVVGANLTICLVALGIGALLAPLPFGRRVLRYALLGLPLGAIGAWFAWDGVVTRTEGGILIVLYLAYVAAIWTFERKPPSLGEVDEIEEAAALRVSHSSRTGRDLMFVLAGVAAMSVGALILVEAVRRITQVEATQTVLGLTLVGFATGFELVVLTWSAARHGASEAAIAGVVGSFAYNVTMTTGAAALVRPLVLHDATQLHVPLLLMLGALGLVIVLAAPKKRLGRTSGFVLLAAYVLFVAFILFRNGAGHPPM